MNASSRHSRRTFWIAACAAALVLGMAAITAMRLRSRGTNVEEGVPLEIRGDPIRPTHSASFGQPAVESSIQNSTPPKRPKPGSYPQRLARSLAAGQGTAPEGESTGTLPPVKIVPVPPMPATPGYEPVSFSHLAHFPFELDKAFVEAAPAADGTSSVLERIPREVRQLDGRKVALQGFLVPVRMDEGLAVEFLLLRDQTLCCYGKLPRPNEWVLVRAAKRGARPAMDEPITVCGILSVGDQRENGVFVGLYRLEAEKLLPEGR